MTEFDVWSPVLVIILAFWNLFSRQTQIQSWLHTSSGRVFSLCAAPLTVPQQQSWGLCNPNLVFLEELAYFYRERPGPDLSGYVGHQNMWQRRDTSLILKENTTIRTEFNTIVRCILWNLILFLSSLSAVKDQSVAKRFTCTVLLQAKWALFRVKRRTTCASLSFFDTVCLNPV